MSTTHHLRSCRVRCMCIAGSSAGTSSGSDAGLGAGPAAHVWPASPSHPDVERGSAEDVRPGAGTGVRLQPRGRDPLVRARGGAGSVARRCRTGARRGRSVRTTTSTSTTNARKRRTTRCRKRGHSRPRRPRARRLTSMRSAARYSANLKTDRAALARAFSQAMADLSQTLS